MRVKDQDNNLRCHRRHCKQSRIFRPSSATAELFDLVASRERFAWPYCAKNCSNSHFEALKPPRHTRRRLYKIAWIKVYSETLDAQLGAAPVPALIVVPDIHAFILAFTLHTMMHTMISPDFIVCAHADPLRNLSVLLGFLRQSPFRSKGLVGCLLVPTSWITAIFFHISFVDNEVISYMTRN